MPIELEGETLATTEPPDSAEGQSSIPTLTVLAHPDPGRVGECLPLRALAIGKDVLLSRIEPAFSRPRDGTGNGLTESGPLGGRFLSRQPIRFRSIEVSGVLVDLSTTQTAVEVDGSPLGEQRAFSSQEIARGVVLRLARKIVLLLHEGPLASPQDADTSTFGLVGGGLALQGLRQEIHNLAPLEVPVLLRGETGTGKELVARALHEESPRKSGPFMAVNMAVLGPSLAAAALFGAERGAYTGADRKRVGHFESARGGTLFLDEIGEAPPEVQGMLLRALETREIQPVGSSTSLEVDVRIVAATDAGLEEAMAEGRFKAPLYHRLGGYTLYLPALRERREDLGRLLYFFLRDELEKLGRPPLEESERPWPPADLVARLALHSWPGNVRELRNVARRLAIAGRGESIPALDFLLPPQSAGQASISSDVAPEPRDVPKSKRRTLRKLEDVEEAELLNALRDNRWHVQATADALNLSRPNLYRLMELSPAVRTANQIGEEEIRVAVAEADGDLEAAAFALEVSVFGLKRRMKALGLSLG